MTEELKEFIKENPYPSYEFIIDILSKKYLDLYVEYGEINHHYCKKIYENCYDDELVINIGKLIHKKGGFTALQANYYVMYFFCPFMKSSNNEIKFYASSFQYIFEKVTDEWKA